MALAMAGVLDECLWNGAMKAPTHDVMIKGSWIDSSYRGIPAKTLLVCGVEVGYVSRSYIVVGQWPNQWEWTAVLNNDVIEYSAWAWPRYGGPRDEFPPLRKDHFLTEQQAQEWVVAALQDAPIPDKYAELMGIT